MLQLLAQTYTYTTTTTSTGELPSWFWPFMIVDIILVVISIVAMWKVFQKAGRPGWAAIVPVYNLWVLFEIVGFPGWLAILGLVPFVNFAIFIVALVAYFKLAKLFGKSDLFAVLTIFFPYITLLILGFGSATFKGAGAAAAPQAPQGPVNPTPPATPAV